MKKVINGAFNVSVIRDNKSVVVTSKDGAFDFTAPEIKDIEAAHGKEALRDPINEAPAAPKTEAEIKAEQVAVVKALLADTANLTEGGDIKMDVLNIALKNAKLPGMNAAARDEAVASLDL